jgi:hypothetical protein
VMMMMVMMATHRRRYAAPKVGGSNGRPGQFREKGA